MVLTRNVKGSLTISKGDGCLVSKITGEIRKEVNSTSSKDPRISQVCSLFRLKKNVSDSPFCIQLKSQLETPTTTTNGRGRRPVSDPNVLGRVLSQSTSMS